jgi:hypothetical protein
MRLSVHRTLDAARRKGLPQTYRVFGRIRPLKPARVKRPQTTQHKKSTNKTIYAPPNCPFSRALLSCACMYIVITPTCTHDSITEETCPVYKTPLFHHDASTNPHEARKIVDMTEKRREDSAEAPHGVTVTLATKPRRAQQNHQEISLLHIRHPQEGEELNPSLHGELMKHTEGIPQERGMR